MAFEDKKGIVVASPFKLQAEALLDVRQQVETIAERDRLVTLKAATAGLRVFVKENSTSYVYTGSKWDPLTTGAPYKHPTGDGNHHVPATGTTNAGKYLKAGATAGSEAWAKIAASDITGLPTKLPNPQALTINNRDASKHVVYTGSEAQAITMSPEWVYGASDAPLAQVGEYQEKGTRYVKLLDILSESELLYNRVHQQFLIMGLEFSFILDLHACQGNSTLFTKYTASYITTSANNGYMDNFLLGVKNVDGARNKIELWYRQDQWKSAIAIIPKGRSADSSRLFKLYSTNSTDPASSTAPVFATKIPIKNNIADNTKLYSSTGQATDGAMTQKAITDALAAKAEKTHTHNYAGSSSAGGSANSAIKLATARTINGVAFDGTKNIEVPNNYAKQLSSEDLNTLTAIGEYFGAGGNTVKNKPAGVQHFGLKVYKIASGILAQKLHGNDNIIYYRNNDNGTFGNWVKIYSGSAKPTPSEIGAAPASHTHTASQVTGLPTKLPNPYMLTLKTNGNVAATYDGSGAKEINITPSAIGAAPASHTHSQYAPTSHTHTASQITGLPTRLPNPQALKFTGAVNATYDGSGAVTVDIPTAQASPHALTLQLNGGTSEGSNKFTFNGGVAKTVNITPGSIGAAPASHTHSQYAPTSHTHTASQITGLPTRLPNPNSLTLQLNGASQGAYDGSAAKTVNITPGSIGAAPVSHSHANYAPINHNHNLADTNTPGFVRIAKTGDDGPDFETIPDSELKYIATSLDFLYSYVDRHLIELTNEFTSGQKIAGKSNALVDSGNSNPITISYAEASATTFSYIPIYTNAGHIGNISKDGFISDLGVAKKSHTHTSNEITGLPTKLPNPNILRFTGISTATYDGSSAVTIDIPGPVNNLTTTVKGKPLDATMGKSLGDRLTAVENRVQNHFDRTGAINHTGYYTPDWNLATDYYDIGNRFNIDDKYYKASVGKSTITLKEGGVYIIQAFATVEADYESKVWGRILKNGVEYYSFIQPVKGWTTVQSIYITYFSLGDTITLQLSKSTDSSTVTVHEATWLQLIKLN